MMNAKTEAILARVKRLRATEIGRLFGVSRQAPSGWAKQGCPRNEDGTYDLGEVIRWRDSQRAPASTVRDDLDRERLQTLRARRQSVEMDLALKTGKYRPTEDVEREWSQITVAVVTALEGMGQALAPHLEGLKAREICTAIDDYVNGIRKAFGGTD